MVAAVVAVAVAPGAAHAENPLQRAGSAVGGFFRSIGNLFRSTPSDPTLTAALDAYDRGDYFTTYLLASRIDVVKQPRLADEADLLKGISAADAGLREPALESLEALLERAPVSPYYPLALASLLDLELRLGNQDAAADAAAKYLGNLWERPPSDHDAQVKAVFLESGAISSSSHPRVERVRHADRDFQFRDRPAERAVYLAGISLIAVKAYDKAALLLECLEPKSAYFSYARYALGQAYYGMERGSDSLEAFSQVQLPSKPTKDASERYLRDRALLVGAQLLHESENDGAAISWLSRVRRDGPFGLHAALLAAQIQADDDKPALALVYLQDRPDSPGEPKLAARAAALDAELRRDMKDVSTAVVRLEQGLKLLDAYAGHLTRVESHAGDIAALIRPLEERQRRRDAFAEWRRRNVASAVPDLIDGRPEPSWAARMVTRMIASKPAEDGYPIIYTPWPYDPFAELEPPDDLPFEPPADGAFPSVFRRSLAEALNDALHKENEVRHALKSADDTHLALLLLAGALELRHGTNAPSAGDQVADLAAMLSLPDEVSARFAGSDGRRDDVLGALRRVKPLAPDSTRHAKLAAIGERQLEMWNDFRGRLLSEAVRAERKSVDDLRLRLTFQLSQTLSEKKQRENKVLEGS